MNIDWLTNYTIRRAAAAPDLSQPCDSADWREVEPIRLNFRLPTEGNYHPPVTFRLQYDDKGLYGLFEVTGDDAIRCVAEKFQDSVCGDSCVECFLEPAGGRGYINFEVNASGVLLAMHVVDPERTPDGFKDFRYLTAAEAAGFRCFHTLPGRVEPECHTPTTYRVAWFIPFSLFTEVTGAPAPKSGDRWRAGVFKCGDDTSKPHYLSWQPLAVTNFHTPQYFGNFIFG